MRGVMWDHLGAIVASIAFLYTVVTGVLGILLRNSMLQMKGEMVQLEVRLTSAITTSKNEIDKRIDETAQDLEDKIDRHSREFGETASALRAKIQEVELWSRDNFVRRDSFYKLTDELKADIKAVGADVKQMGADIQARIDRMDGGKDRSE